jgi:hypothetical protein
MKLDIFAGTCARIQLSSSDSGTSQKNLGARCALRYVCPVAIAGILIAAFWK